MENTTHDTTTSNEQSRDPAKLLTKSRPRDFFHMDPLDPNRTDAQKAAIVGVNWIPGFEFPDGPYREARSGSPRFFRYRKPLEFTFEHALQTDDFRTLRQYFRMGSGAIESRICIHGDPANLTGAETFLAASLAAEAIRAAVLSSRFNA